MIDELQDEVYTLRSQHEYLKHRLAQRDVDSGSSFPGEMVEGREITTTMHIIDLNGPTKLVEDMDKITNGSGHT